MISLAALLVAALAAVLGPPQESRAAAPPPQPAPVTQGPETLIAELRGSAVALRAPRADARPRLRLSGAGTWSGGLQGLMVTGRHRDGAGRDWVRVQLPVRPNGSRGWLPLAKVRLWRTHTRFLVRLGSRRLEIWSGRRRVATFPIGIGRPGTPTPTGRFAIQDPLRTPARLRPVYGPWTLILTAHSEAIDQFNGGDALIGIHGAGNGRAWRVGEASSFGCVILSDRDLAAVARRAWPGTPVVITRA